MSISQLARSIEPSPTLKMNEEARLLRQKGEPVIHLGIGEPKNKAPISALLSSAAKLNTGDIKYTPSAGIPTLVKAVIRYTEENYGRVVATNNVIVSGGAKQSLYNLLLTIVDPQDEVILLAPYWVSYPEMVKLTHGVPVVVTPEDGSFQPSMEEIERATSSYTKAIILNSPNNPSGFIYSDDFIAEMVAFCEKRRDLPDHGRHLPQARLRWPGTAARLYLHEQGRRKQLRDCRQRRLQAVRHDRLPHRLDGWPQPDHRGDGRHPVGAPRPAHRWSPRPGRKAR